MHHVISSSTAREIQETFNELKTHIEHLQSRITFLEKQNQTANKRYEEHSVAAQELRAKQLSARSDLAFLVSCYLKGQSSLESRLDQIEHQIDFLTDHLSKLSLG